MATDITITTADMSQPIVRQKHASARSYGGMYTEIDTGEYGYLVTDEPIAHGGTGEGPSPLQTVLGALLGCESVTFNRAARDMDFSYDGIDFEAGYTIDVRGRMGVRGVIQYFQSVKVDAVVTTDEPQERLQAVIEETEARCPVFNLVKDAGVRIEVRWVAKPRP